MTGRYRRWDGGPTRICARCSEPRPLAEFRRDSRGYVRSHCIACSLVDTREWRARNRDRLLPERRARYAARCADPGGEKREGAVSNGVVSPVPLPPGGTTRAIASRERPPPSFLHAPGTADQLHQCISMQGPDDGA